MAVDQQMLGVHVHLAVTAVSLHPVRLCLHLHQSGDGPLEGKDLLLGREQRETLRRLLKREDITTPHHSSCGCLSTLFEHTHAHKVSPNKSKQRVMKRDDILPR